MRVLSAFQPLVEVGCGSNAYWGRRLRETGVDVKCYDVDVEGGGVIDRPKKKIKQAGEDGGDGDFKALKGGPEVLLEPGNLGRNLFLCFPDEDLNPSDPSGPPLGVECLSNYSGEYVIHVGELFGETVSHDQAPFGRSSSMEFQCHLAKDFHCILKASLPRWPHEGQTISVWKRTTICDIHFGDDEDDSGEEVGEGEENKISFKHIPEDEGERGGD